MPRITASLILLLIGSITAFGAADSALLALLPADTQMVTSMDVNTSRASSFGQFILRQMSANDQAFQHLTEQTGFDPKRDLQTFIFASAPQQAGSTAQRGRFIVLARGIFDQNRISLAAASKGMTSQLVDGTKVLVSSDGDRQTALAFPETTVAVFGDQGSVEQVLRNRANPSVLSPDLQAQIQAAGAHSDAWFASTLPANDLLGHMPKTTDAEPMRQSMSGSQAMQGIVQSSGGIKFGSSVELSFNALTRSDKDATSLADLIRFVSSTIQMQRGNDPRATLIAPAIDSMTLTASGRSVSTKLSIPEADLEQIVAASPQQKRSAQSR